MRKSFIEWIKIIDFKHSRPISESESYLTLCKQNGDRHILKKSEVKHLLKAKIY